MTSLPLCGRLARDWPRRRRGFESHPRSGRVLPKCHVGSGCGAEPARGAGRGSGAGRRPLGGCGARVAGGRALWSARAAAVGGGAASCPRAALAEGGGAEGPRGAAAEAEAEAGRRRRGTLPPEAPAEMLAENLVEEFEMKEDEPWYDHRDLQQDLQLAAELGKTLLDRNTELEDSLQQMYTTNQEQLQEIEYLTKQIELLRQMNEQHAKVYEQLDVTARELEETNQKLVADSKASQQKILSLTETIECLQTNIDHLQSQVEELKSSGQGRRRPGRYGHEDSTPSFCLKELYDLRQHFVYDHVFAEKITSLQSQQSPDEEENEHLKKTVTMLQAQLSLERQRRVAVEEEYGLVLRENSELEQQLGAADAYRARAVELEAEVAEMRQMLQMEHPFVNGVEKLVTDSLFVPFKDPSQSLLEEMFLTVPEAPRKPLKRSSSETVLSSLAGGDIVKGHEETCIRRAKAVKQRGISLLHEVDTQYSALKVKYEDLLKKCQQEQDSLSHKAVQTSRAPAKDLTGASTPSEPCASSWEPASATLEPAGSPSTTTPPEYKALFKEIFSCIKKTKQEIDEQRTKYPSLAPYS